MNLDRDTLTVIDLLTDALTTSGLTAAGFARALGTSAPRLSTYLAGTTRPSAHFLARAQRISRALHQADQAGWMSAPSTATAIRAALRAGEPTWAWRMLLQGRDHLHHMLTTSKTADAWEAAPTSTGSPQWDTLLAAITTHEHHQAGLPAPAWANVDPLPHPWTPAHPFLTPDRVKAQTPDWLNPYNIHIPARDLITA